MGRLRSVSIGVVGVGAALAAVALGTAWLTPSSSAVGTDPVGAQAAETAQPQAPSRSGASASPVAAGAAAVSPSAQLGNAAPPTGGQDGGAQPVVLTKQGPEPSKPQPPQAIASTARGASAARSLDLMVKEGHGASAQAKPTEEVRPKASASRKSQATAKVSELPAEMTVDKPGAEAIAAALPHFASRRGKAVVVGSSSVRGYFGRVISDELEERGFEVTRRGVVSAGLARPDYRDIDEVIDAMPIDGDTAAVFVYVGMNDGQSIWLRPEERKSDKDKWVRWKDPRWPDVYAGRARSLFRSICDRGAERAFVMLPIEVPKRRLEFKMQRIRKLQRQAADEVSCARAVATVGEEGKFVFRGKSLRTKDGFHMTRQGARLVWDRVKRRELGSWEPWAQLELSPH